MHPIFRCRLSSLYLKAPCLIMSDPLSGLALHKLRPPHSPRLPRKQASPRQTISYQRRRRRLAISVKNSLHLAISLHSPPVQRRRSLDIHVPKAMLSLQRSRVTRISKCSRLGKASPQIRNSRFVLLMNLWQALMVLCRTPISLLYVPSSAVKHVVMVLGLF